MAFLIWKNLEISISPVKERQELFDDRFLNLSKRIAMELSNGIGKTIIVEAATIDASGIIIYTIHAISSFKFNRQNFPAKLCDLRQKTRRQKTLERRLSSNKFVLCVQFHHRNLYKNNRWLNLIIIIGSNCKESALLI